MTRRLARIFRQRPGPPRRRARPGHPHESIAASALFGASAILVPLGLAWRFLPGEELGTIVAVLGIAAFVLRACMTSGAADGGHVGHPDINRWTI